MPLTTKRRQALRRERLKEAAQRLGFGTIDRLAKAINAADDAQLKRIRDALGEVLASQRPKAP